ncbi:DcaP family trimeric outer membrane transporter [Billgrantia lactosivorans]|uniref:DcaP family trimeric outer membrane transporter n=1 Tax=Billgrantia lactosivorans TaxID=2185141 RepID=UPI000DAF004A|nr:DcaP family trimeric outer membrane transporter [Halomonas lactosivorans]
MTTQNNAKQIALLSVGAMTLAAAVSTHAYEFEVGETTASIFGYVKLDVIYDIDNELGDTVDRSAPRLDGDEGSDGHFNMHARESRIGFSTSSPVAGSELKTTIEGDFYGDGSAFRLRHAYGEWNDLLAGQTWTNFAGFVSSTPLISFTGPTGRPAVERQPQLRYTSGKLSMALENPADEGGQVSAPGAKSQLPDVTLRYTDTEGTFHYSFSGVARYLEFDSSGIETPAASDAALGWGLGVEVAMEMGNLTLRGALTHGDGIGGYNQGNPQIAPAFATSEGELETIESTGGTLGASLAVGPGDFNAAYSLINADLDSNPAFTTNDDTYEAAWINYIWSPAQSDRISYGIEANWNKRETVEGPKGDASRIQGMVMYSF